MAQNTLVAFLDLLKVKHTQSFSDQYFNEHPHKYNLFGLSKMLSDYGVENAATRIPDKLIFNRPDTTLRVFSQIRKMKPARLYIAAAGPRNPEEKNVCEEVREITTMVDWDCHVFTLFRDRNLGCGRAVSEAISWFFEHETEGIILEDDCLPADSFFRFLFLYA